MITRFARYAAPVLGALILVSCGADEDVLMLASNTQEAASKGEALYQKAKSADGKGRTGTATRLYARMADLYPSAPSAEKARLRQAQLLEQKGEIVDAFEAYDGFLSRYPGSNQYMDAVTRQAAMAQSAADGDIKSSFLGLKTRLSLEKTVEMLEKVAVHAPRSRTSSKAQFSIGELYQAKRNKSKEAIAAYRKLVSEQPDSVEAPEGLFRVGLILLEEADRGNQNQANLDLAREAFNDYLIQYPGHSKNGEARRLLGVLSGRDVERSFEIAEFYRKTERYESAKVYYRDIVKRTGSGDIHEKAKARLKELGE